MQITLSIADRISGSLAKVLSVAQSRDLAESSANRRRHPEVRPQTGVLFLLASRGVVASAPQTERQQERIL